MSIEKDFLGSVIKRFRNYKDLGDKTFEQLDEKDFFLQPNASSNSIAIIMQHLYGNMLSRWTNFLTEDGEKEWRKRDAEFEIMQCSKQDLLSFWNEGWNRLLQTLESLREEDLNKIVHIRTEPLTVVDAIIRQLAHYSSHVGQIIYIGRWIKEDKWASLSVPKGQSDAYNESMKKREFKQP